MLSPYHSLEINGQQDRFFTTCIDFVSSPFFFVPNPPPNQNNNKCGNTTKIRTERSVFLLFYDPHGERFTKDLKLDLATGFHFDMVDTPISISS